MEAGPEASWDIESEISENRKLIQMLSEEEDVMLNQVKIVEDEIHRINMQINPLQHFKIERHVKILIEEINLLEKFPDMLSPPTRAPCIWEEQIRTLTSNLHHGKTNLIAERKKLRQIQQLEREREQHNLDLSDQDGCDKQKFKIPKQNQRVSDLLEEWVERIKHVSELMITDRRRNDIARWESVEALYGLIKFRCKVYGMVDETNRERFQRSWKSMRDVNNIIQHFRPRLGKMKQTSTEAYAELIQLEQKKRAISSHFWDITRKLRLDVQLPKHKACRRLKRLEDRRKQSMTNIE